MAKIKTKYVCSVCGYNSVRWLGKCPECASWDTMDEQIEASVQSKTVQKTGATKLVPLGAQQREEQARISCGIAELDRVLGGGCVPGSVILVGGDPGIGKSTLMLQLLDRAGDFEHKIYLSGEESRFQIEQRARRLNVQDDNILFMSDTRLEAALATLPAYAPAVVVVDSVQTLSSELVDGIPGNGSQLRYCTTQLTRLAKEHNLTLFLIGHVTKEGVLAGPRLLEHLVDTVLYFEGERTVDFRILRTTKNRFGAVNEIALFQMDSGGLQPVVNPSEIFLNQNHDDRTGTAVVAVMEGNRPMLVEVQALVSKTQFGMPQRTATGIDHRRMNLLLAVLDKKCGKPFGFFDVFVKAAAGLRLDEPAADLGICMALASSMDDRQLPARAVYIGEVGLTGELRPVNMMQERINEAEKLGFRAIYLPRGRKSFTVKKARLIYHSHLQKLLE